MSWLTGIFSVFSALKELISLIRSFLDMVAAHQKADAIKNTQDREKAVDELANAKTEEEADAAQDAIVAHKPRP